MDKCSDALHTTAEAITIDGPGGESYMEDGLFSTLVSLPREMGGSGEGFSPAKFLALGCSSSFSFTMAALMEEAVLAGRTRMSCKVSKVPDNAGRDPKFAIAPAALLMPARSSAGHEKRPAIAFWISGFSG